MELGAGIAGAMHLLDVLHSHPARQCEEMTANYQESSQHCEELRHRLNEFLGIGVERLNSLTLWVTHEIVCVHILHNMYVHI